MKARVTSYLLLLALLNPASASAAWDGVVDWARRTEMSTPLSGVVARVLVRAGERVKQNTVLLQLEQTAIRAQLESAKSSQQHAKLMRDEAKRELDRAQELYDRTLLADHDLNLAKLTYAKADAEYQRAHADLLASEERLQNSELIAPFDAVVLDRRVQPGQTVVNQLRAEPMLTIASATEMLVRFYIETDDISEIAPGKAVDVKSDGNRYRGEISSLVLDSAAGQSYSGKTGYAVEVIFQVDGFLAPGTAASVSLP